LGKKKENGHGLIIPFCPYFFFVCLFVVPSIGCFSLEKKNVVINAMRTLNHSMSTAAVVSPFCRSSFPPAF
jgi:hypothetical protein